MPDPVASQTGNGTKTNDQDELRLSDGTRAGHVKIMQTAVLMLRKETNKIHFASGDPKTESGVQSNTKLT